MLKKQNVDDFQTFQLFAIAQNEFGTRGDESRVLSKSLNDILCLLE
jgi:hypothetical protein